AKIGFATFANAFFVGAFIVALTAIPQVDGLSEDPLGVRIGLLALSMPLYGLGSALYLGAWLGAGPRDSLMVVLGQRTGLRLGVVRAAIELCALVAGFALGGPIGVGTVVFALTIGPALEAGFWALQRSRFGATEPAPTPVAAPLAGSGPPRAADRTSRSRRPRSRRRRPSHPSLGRTRCACRRARDRRRR